MKWTLVLAVGAFLTANQASAADAGRIALKANEYIKDLEKYKDAWNYAVGLADDLKGKKEPRKPRHLSSKVSPIVWKKSLRS